MASHQLVCEECGTGFTQVIVGSGRKSKTCSVECNAERIRQRDRDRNRRKKGEAFLERQTRGGPCSVGGCESPALNRGFCLMHYARSRRKGDPGPAQRMKELCSIEGCGQSKYARGWCNMHYTRNLTQGSPGEPERRKRRGSGRDHGYVVVYVDGGKVLEHRFVMARVLGRRLETFENVHHRNGVRSDNRPDNLELWVKPQAAGQRVEDLVAWVVEHYPEYVKAALHGGSTA